MRQLSSTWSQQRIGDVAASIQYGYTASSAPHGEFRFLRITDIQNGKVVWENVPYCDITEKEYEKYALKKNDIVFVRTGATVGKSFLISDVPHKSVFASYLIRFTLKEGVLPKYIKYFFNSPLYWNQINENAAGIGQPNFNSTKLSNIVFPLPPLPEQKRIVAKLDTLFAHLDQLRSRLDKIPVLLKQFRQAVLTQAVTGKLTEEWRRARGLSSWRNTKLGGLVVCLEAGKNFSCPEIPVENGKVGLVKISAVTWDKFDITQTKTVKDLHQVKPKYFIKKGDFLISRANTIELVGSSVIVDQIEHDVMISDKVWRVTFLTDVTKWFVHWYLKSSVGRHQIESRATGNQISMRNLSQDNFRDIDISLPPVKEQIQVKSRIESLFKLADRIEEQHRSLREMIDHVPQVILSRAFQGDFSYGLDGKERKAVRS